MSELLRFMRGRPVSETINATEREKNNDLGKKQFRLSLDQEQTRIRTRPSDEPQFLDWLSRKSKQRASRNDQRSRQRPMRPIARRMENALDALVHLAYFTGSQVAE